MKKILVFILTCTYIISTSGATIYFQDCMGKTVGWSISGKAATCTKCGGMQDYAGNSCCSGHVKVLKVHNDQTLPEAYFNNILFFADFFPADFHVVKDFKFSSWPEKTPFYSRPPPKDGFCVLYCTFII